MYKRLTKSDSLDAAPEDELPPEPPVAQKPLLGLYLVGWGIALIVCGISGAVNMRDYAGYSHCFLMPGPAMSAVFIPVGMLVSFLLVFYLLIRCSIQNLDTNGQLSEGTQATENVDLDLLDSNITNTTTAERTSLRSASTPTASSDVEDPEHSPQSQLKAHVIVLMLYLLMWTSAAIATVKPFKNHFPYEEIIFSVLYCFLASCLGIFVTFFYCIARSDVRAQWHLMECWCKRRRGRCCRTRSISDTNPTLPASQPLAPITNVGPRAGNAVAVSSSNSINSSGHTAKSHNSSVTKAAVELNGTAKRDVDAGRKMSNVNLVVLHRQQYRSNNSVTTFTEASGASGAEMFYNPHQSTVARKFFRKQRRHLKHNNLGTRRRGDGGGGNSDAGTNARAESAVFLSSDMENASSIYSPSSKVNNTNVHVERPHRSSRCRDAKSQNPNILTDSGGDDTGNCHDLPLERLVIGAEETNVSAPNSKDGPPLGSDSESHEVRSKPIGIPEEGIGETISDCANNVRTESNLVNNTTEDCCETDRVRKCLNTSTSNVVCCENKNKSDSIEKQDHDNVAENEQNNKDDLGKVRVLGQKSELLLKGKKLSLPSNEMKEINKDDVPTPNKKETSV